MNNRSQIAVMMEGASCVALSVVLSYLTIFRMPQGGSIDLELVPLFVFAYRRGVRWGLVAGALAGFLQLILNGYVVHPVQAILDYPAAFAAAGLAGVFASRKIISTIIAGLAGVSCHILAGAIFFASYAPEGTNAWVYSTIYNGTFYLPKIIVSGIVAILIFNKLKKIYS